MNPQLWQLAGTTGFREPPLKLEGAADRWNFREDDDDYYTSG